MKYKKADVLPAELLKEVQKYIQGALIYIPNREGQRKKWGEKSGSRSALQQRNEEIRRLFRAGATIEQLAIQYCLSWESIKKIVYFRKK